MKKIGVFICHCGINIASTVDVKKVAEAVKDIPGVEISTDYIYMCSDPGQNLVKETIVEKGLDGVVVAACSPTLHENTFRSASQLAGLNPYVVEMANIREQCSWVHTDKESATKKATKIVKNIIEKVRYNESLEPISVPITRKALVIGGGISGIQAALDIANSGYEVSLVERSPSIGGHMIQPNYFVLRKNSNLMIRKVLQLWRNLLNPWVVKQLIFLLKLSAVVPIYRFLKKM